MRNACVKRSKPSVDFAGSRSAAFSHGNVEFLPIPTDTHERILRFLFRILDATATARRLGDVRFAGTRVRLRAEKFRVPDLVFMKAEHGSRITEDYWDGADLVLEVVNGGASDRHRDLVKKGGEYAQAGTPEYWIVDPQEGQITVLTLRVCLRSPRRGRSDVAGGVSPSVRRRDTSPSIASPSRPRPRRGGVAAGRDRWVDPVCGSSARSRGADAPGYVRSPLTGLRDRPGQTLNGTEYAVHGILARGDQATSKLLPGLSVDVTAALVAGR